MEGGNSANKAQSLKLVDLLKELSEYEALASKVHAREFNKKTKDFVSNKVSDLKKYVDDQAGIYKQTKTDVASVIEYYEGILAQARAEYKKEAKSLIQEKGEWEATEKDLLAEKEEKLEEFKKMPGYKEFAKRKAEIRQLRKQGKTKEATKKREEFEEYKGSLQQKRKALEIKINLSIQKGDLETAEMQMKNLKKLQKECKLAECDTELGKINSRIRLCRKNMDEQNRKIEECERKFEEASEEITSSQEKALSEVDKQNIFQKLLVRVFGSAKQFDKNVMSPLKQKMQKFKNETLPAKVEQMGKDARKRKEDLKDKTGQVIDSVGNTFTSIIDGAKKKKDGIINGLKGKMLDRINKNKQKVLDYNLNNPESQIGVSEQYEK